MDVSVHYLSDIIVLLAAALIAVPVFQAMRLGAISGFLLAGTALGPSGLAYFRDLADIRHLAELGVVFLLFVIGIELRPTHFWRMRKHVFGLGSCQVLLSGAALSLLAFLLLGVAPAIAVLIGFALALSSTAFVLQLLSEQKALNTQHGRPAIAVLLLQDLAVVPLLAFVTMLGHKQHGLAADVILAFLQTVLILLLAVLVARHILNPLFTLLARFAGTPIFTPAALLLVLGFATLFEQAGLSLAMGAFVAGVLIADSSFRHQISAEVEPFRILLLGLFFMTMGMSLNLDLLLDKPLPIVAAVCGLLVVKFFVLLPLAKQFHVPPRSAIALALLLAQSGEFALVLFGVAFSQQLLSADLFQLLLIVVLLSMLLTPLLNMLAQASLKTIAHQPQCLPQVHRPNEGSPPILIVGFGRMGHRIGELFDLLKVAYVAIDENINIVNAARRKDLPVYFGDARKPEVLRAAGAATTPLAIVAIDSLEAAEKVVATLHLNFPKLAIFARGHNRARCRELRAQGAQFTVSETFEASSEIAREALLLAGVKAQRVDNTMREFKLRYYAEVQPATLGSKK